VSRYNNTIDEPITLTLVTYNQDGELYNPGFTDVAIYHLDGETGWVEYTDISLNVSDITEVIIGQYTITITINTAGIYKDIWTAGDTTFERIFIVEEDTGNSLLGRVIRQLGPLADSLSSAAIGDALMHSEADVKEIPSDLSELNKWDISWLTNRAVRHCYQIILNQWLLIPSISQPGSNIGAGNLSTKIMDAIRVFDSHWEREQQRMYREIIDGVVYWRKIEESAVADFTSVQYDVERDTGIDSTQYKIGSHETEDDLVTTYSKWWYSAI